MHRPLSLVVIFIVSIAAHAQEWTRFRGPNGSGISDTRFPVKWTDKDYKWKISLPGSGGSSPVVWGNRLFITSADVTADKRYLLCIDTKTGKTLWQKPFAFAKYKKQKNNTFASNTPVCDRERVYVLWQGPKKSPVVAFDHQGKKIWEIDLGPYKHGQGGAVSPIVYQDMVIIDNDHKEGSFLLAVDSKTGKQRWKIPREGKRACYSTPCIYQAPGRKPEIIFTHSFEGIIGVDAVTGKQNWHIDPFGRFQQRAIASPVIVDDLIIGSSGFTTGKKNLIALRLRPTTTGVKAEEVYRLTKSVPHIPTPLVYQNRLYLWGDTGIVTCSDAKTGKEIWKGRTSNGFFGSPVCADGRQVCIDKSGNVIILATGDTFQILGKVPLGESSQATPAISGGLMFLRTASHLFALGSEKK